MKGFMMLSMLLCLAGSRAYADVHTYNEFRRDFHNASYKASMQDYIDAIVGPVWSCDLEDGGDDSEPETHRYIQTLDANGQKQISGVDENGKKLYDLKLSKGELVMDWSDQLGQYKEYVRLMDSIHGDKQPVIQILMKRPDGSQFEEYEYIECQQ